MRKDAENRILRAHGIPLATIVNQYEQKGHGYVPEDDKTLERALKWHIIQHEALLRMSNDRGGHTARRRQVGAQLASCILDYRRLSFFRILCLSMALAEEGPCGR